jgi:outer membrane immunogenic protein
MWLATLRGRGGLAFDSTLVYVTGGVAFGHVKDSFEVRSATSARLASFTQNKTKVGWTAGVGVEHMFSPHWTARAEFRYVDLGTTAVACSSATDFNLHVRKLQRHLQQHSEARPGRTGI